MPGFIQVLLAAIATTGMLTAISPFVLAEAPLDPNELVPIDFVVADVQYSILLPKRSQLSRTNSPGCVQIWHPRSTRLMTFLELCSAIGSLPKAFAKQATLANGAQVHYTIDHDIGGGNAGTEGELKGRLDLDGRALVLTCRDQGEWGNRPDWCLRYLAYLEVKERK